MSTGDGRCVHLAPITTPRTAKKPECEACAKAGATWVNLRTCQGCGTTLCCDSSPNRHASAHARSSGHAVISSAMPGERWMYCFTHGQTVEY